MKKFKLFLEKYKTVFSELPNVLFFFCSIYISSLILGLAGYIPYLEEVDSFSPLHRTCMVLGFVMTCVGFAFWKLIRMFFKFVKIAVSNEVTEQ